MGCGREPTHARTNDNGIPIFPHIERHIIGFHIEQAFDFFSF
jgi:hypothetical protein